jgi:hypothetical protein
MKSAEILGLTLFHRPSDVGEIRIYQAKCSILEKIVVIMPAL